MRFLLLSLAFFGLTSAIGSNSGNNVKLRLNSQFKKLDTPQNPYGPGGNPLTVPPTSGYQAPPTVAATTQATPAPTTQAYVAPTTQATVAPTTQATPAPTTAIYLQPTSQPTSVSYTTSTTTIRLEGTSNAALAPTGSGQYSCTIPAGATDFEFTLTTTTSAPIDLTYNVNGGASQSISNSHVSVPLTSSLGSSVDIGVGIGGQVQATFHCNNPAYTTPAPTTQAPPTQAPSTSAIEVTIAPTSAAPTTPIYNAALTPPPVTYTPPETPRGTYYDRTNTLPTRTCVDTATNYNNACKLVTNTTAIMGYRPGTDQPVYNGYCAGSCFSFQAAPNLCQSGSSNMLLTSGKNQDASTAGTISVVTSCACGPASCQVVDKDTNTLVTYPHGSTAYDSCNQQCTCSAGKLVNCCRQRKDWRDAMSELERERFVNTVLYVTTVEPFKSQWVKLQELHLNWFYKGIHGNPVFLPWHRWLLLQFENVLQQVDCRVTIPFWDWSKEATSPFNSIVWDNSTSGLGGNGDASDQCVRSGPFAYPAYKLPRDGSCLKRNFDNTAAFATVADIQQLLKTFAAPTSASYVSYEENIESGPGLHGAVHCAIGGTMCATNSADAPEFILHHSYIDTLWYDFQTLSPANLNAYPAPLLGATMPGTTDISAMGFTAEEFINFQNQTSVNGSVSICYVSSPQFQWVPAVTTPLSIETLQAIPRVPVCSAVPFALIMNMSSEAIAAITQRDNIRNGVTGNSFVIIDIETARNDTGHLAFLGCNFTESVLAPLNSYADLTNTNDTQTPSPSVYSEVPAANTCSNNNVPINPYAPVNFNTTLNGTYINNTCTCATGLAPTEGPTEAPTTAPPSNAPTTTTLPTAPYVTLPPQYFTVAATLKATTAPTTQATVAPTTAKTTAAPTTQATPAPTTASVYVAPTQAPTTQATAAPTTKATPKPTTQYVAPPTSYNQVTPAATTAVPVYVPPTNPVGPYGP